MWRITLQLLGVLFVATHATQHTSSNLRRDLGDYDDNDYDDKVKKNPKNKQCQQVNFKGPYEFDLDQYIQRSWYIQKQQVTSYQPPEDLFCVTATYNKRPDGLIQVQNTGNRNSVTGESLTSTTGDAGSIFGQLCAKEVIKGAGKLRVQPCIFAPLSAIIGGPYWIVAIKEDPLEQAHDYKWAIISGGQPDVFIERKYGRNFCTTKNTTSNCFGRSTFFDTVLDPGEGLWLLTRERVAPKETIDEMMVELTALGYYTGGLVDVPHEGCSYPTNIKT